MFLPPRKKPVGRLSGVICKARRWRSDARENNAALEIHYKVVLISE